MRGGAKRLSETTTIMVYPRPICLYPSRAVSRTAPAQRLPSGIFHMIVWGLGLSHRGEGELQVWDPEAGYLTTGGLTIPQWASCSRSAWFGTNTRGSRARGLPAIVPQATRSGPLLKPLCGSRTGKSDSGTRSECCLFKALCRYGLTPNKRSFLISAMLT